MAGKGVGGTVGGRVAVVGVGIEVALDDDGRFAITGLPEGQVSICARSPCSAGVRSRIRRGRRRDCG